MTHRHPSARIPRRAERLDRERGAVRKNWRHRRTVALIYPNTYVVGMANLGLQAVYGLLNAMDDVVCERVFVPDPPPLVLPWPAPRSLESGRALADFDILAFSIAFESDFANVLALLAAAGLPLEAGARAPGDPLVIAGGVACWINPEPLAEVIDIFLIGEAEALLASFMAVFDPGKPREPLLYKVAREVSGAYVPRFYHPEYHDDGTLKACLPCTDVPDRIARARVHDLSDFSTTTCLQPAETPFSSDFLIEVSRGCPHGCRFCAAGYVYRPARFRSLASLSTSLESVPPGTRRVGLVGAAVSDLPDLDSLCQGAEGLGLTLGFSSFRADAISTSLLASLARSGAKTVTIAPETGSQRLRDAINKHLTEAVILDAAERLVGAGIANLKLYFMIGLPGETPAEVTAIVDLVKRIKRCFLHASRPRGRIGTITVSLNPFVPKPFTPLQWVAMETPANLKTKIRAVREGLRALANVRVQAGKVRQAVTQALLARGDRRVGRLLRYGWPRGDPGWAAAADLNRYLYRQRPVDEVFAWEVIDHGVARAFLWEEYRRYRKALLAPPCPPRGCTRCGACREDENQGLLALR